MRIKSLLLAAVIAGASLTGAGTRIQEAVEEAVQVDTYEAETVAKLVWGEARGCTETEQAAVIWCVLNRVDAGYGSIAQVITAPYQFTGYRAGNPVTEELYALAVDVLTRWRLEKLGGGNVGRVLPSDYLWFTGDGRHNHFRNAYRGGTYWDWSLPSPYER